MMLIEPMMDEGTQDVHREDAASMEGPLQRQRCVQRPSNQRQERRRA